MKVMIFALLSCLISFIECEEEPPFIDLTTKTAQLKDTNYLVSPVPAAQSKVVLIEDISGVKCVNCPKAAVKADELIGIHGEKIAVITLMPDSNLLSNFTSTNPGYANLGLNKVNQLLNYLTPPSGMPIGMIDRTDNGNGLMSVYPVWSGDVDIQLAKTTPVNIELASSFDATTRKLLITATITYTQDQLADSLQRLDIILTESNIVGKQKTPAGDVENYVFKHIARDFATNPTGDALPTNLTAGRRIVREYQLDILPSWNIDECEIVAFVHSVKTKVVLQTQHHKAK